MKIRNHKIYKPILTFALFVTCAVCALFAMDGEETGFAELPVSSPEVPAVLETEALGDKEETGEESKYPNIKIEDTEVKDNYALKRRPFGVLEKNKNDPFKVGHPKLNHYYQNIFGTGENIDVNAIQPAHTMEIAFYVNDFEEKLSEQSEELNLFQNIFMQNRIFYAHVYDSTRENGLADIIDVNAKYLEDFFVLKSDNHGGKEEGYFFTSKIQTFNDDSNVNPDDEKNYLTQNSVSLTLHESVALCNKQIVLDVFSMRSNNSTETQTGDNKIQDTQTMRNGTIIKSDGTEITEPDVYVRYLYNIKSGKDFMNGLRSGDYPRRTIYAPDSMYFQMRLKHPAQDYLFKDQDNKMWRLSRENFVTNLKTGESPLRLVVTKDGETLPDHGFFIENNFLHFYNKEKSKEGTYTVQLWTNKNCKWVAGEEKDFCLAEWEITFLPLSEAGMLKQKELDHLEEGRRYLAPKELDSLVKEEKATLIEHISFGMDPFDPNNNAGGLNRWNIYSRFFFEEAWNWDGIEGLKQTGDPSRDDHIKSTLKTGNIKNDGAYPFPILPFEQSSYGWIQRRWDPDYDYQSYRIVQNTNSLYYKDYLSNIVDKEGSAIKLPACKPGSVCVYDHNAYKYVYKPELNEKGLAVYDFDQTTVNNKYPSGMMYINAAGTPGRMLQLEGQAKGISQGSYIYVSMWVNELSMKNTTANIGISIKAYGEGEDTNKEENGVELANYLTGFVPKWGSRDAVENYRKNTYQHPIYNPEAYGGYKEELENTEQYSKQYFTSPSYVERCRGEWMNVCFSFVPDIEKLEGKDKIVVVLSNNCFNSNGADLLLDDVRLYAIKPEIKADVTETCVNTTAKERLVTAKISMDFNSLDAFSTKNSGEVTCYYSFWGKNGKQDGSGNDLWEPIACQYDELRTGETKYGSFKFKAKLEENRLSDGEMEKLPSNQMRCGKDENDLYFFTYPSATKLRSGKEYIVEFYFENLPDNSKLQPKAFSSDNTESTWSKFSVKGGFQVRIDGKSEETESTFDLLQQPVITPKMNALIEGNGKDKVTYDGYFDFFNGPLDKFEEANITIGGKKMSLNDILVYFRADFPNAIDPKAVTIEEKGQFTKEMQEKLVSEKDNFKFHEKSCMAWRPNVGENHKPNDTIQQKLTIIPIVTQHVLPEGKTLLCWGPYEYTLRYLGDGPTLDPGFPDVNYPDGTRGIRIGLNDLRALTSGSKTLTIPLQKPKWKGDAKHPEVIISSYEREGDSEAYAYLVTGPYLDDSKPEGSKEEEVFQEKYRIATVKELAFTEDGTGNKLILERLKEGNLLDDPNFKFREGEIHHIRVQYQVTPKATTTAGEDADNAKPLVGDFSVNLKIVPEFQTWTPLSGATSNWNNDANWRRSDKKALHKEDADPYPANGDGSDSYPQTSNGFVPMYFTKVTEATADPQAELYARKESGKSTKWYTPVAGDTGGNNILDLKLEGTKVTQTATPDIEYELMADVKTVSGNREISLSTNFTDLSCRPYYTNTCAQIHFQPNTEMLNTQYLVYDTAWVDYELKPHRWYTLASPLKAIYAGDWYAPTKSYRQETEYFRDITFDDKDVNSRIDPAVYQRSWEKGRVLPDLNTPATNYANWSIVYNDVDVAYQPGIGFSVNTVIPSASSTDVPAGNKVLFRMPKEDTSYSIYDYSNGGSVKDTENVDKDKTSDGHGKLQIEDAKGSNSFEVTINHESGNEFNHTYFLVGNPFMAHLDMEKFFDVNKNEVFEKYWLVSDGMQSINLSKDPSDSIGKNVAVAPLQSFFVKTKEDNIKSLRVSFNTDMQKLGSPVSADGSLLRSIDAPHILTLTAGEEGKQSTARIAMRNGADDEFADNEDAELLLDSNLGDIPAIYTVAGTQTASVNVRSNFVHIPIGVYSPNNGDVPVTVSVGADFADLSLYDAENKTTRPLVGDESSFTLEGNCHGRYFLCGTYTATANEELLAADVISIYSPKRGEVIVTASAPLQSIRVYTLDGKLYTARADVNMDVVRLTLPAGIYAVQAMTQDANKTDKVIVR